MLTRIEIDGFKSFEDFQLDLMPFTAIVGPNASGKSNLFDALKLLSRIAEKSDLREAFLEMRGDPTELFRVDRSGRRADRMTFAADLLLDRSFTDQFGETFSLSQTRIRYKITVERRKDDRSGLERLYVVDEQALPISKSSDAWATLIKIPYPEFKELLGYRRTKNAPFIETEDSPVGRRIVARQDGVQGRPRPADRASASLLSTITNPRDFRHLYALKQALTKLTFLQLDPASERLPSDLIAQDELLPNGSNLAAVLYRIQQETKTPDRQNGIISDIESDLSSLIPGAGRIEVSRNEDARQYQLFADIDGGPRFTSRVLSDGTLRLLALVTLLNDARRRGALCFEEPENGVHEGRIEPLINLLRDSTHREPDDTQSPLFQILINTHSPEVLKNLKDWEVVAADVETVVAPNGETRRRSRMRRYVERQGELLDFDEKKTITRFELDEILRRGNVAA